MQRKLHANWRALYQEELLRGQFLIHSNLAAGIPSQLLSLIQGKDKETTNESDLHIDVRSYDYDGNEYEDFGGSESQQTVVAVIPIKGTMYKYGSWRTYGALDIAEIIIEAAGMENVSAIVLDIDSGGGSTAAIPPLKDAILYAKSLGKIVVAHGDMTCSAAYWIASLCNYIFVNNNLTSTYGSIGVMISFADYKPYFEQLGVVFHEIYADESDQKNKVFTEAEQGKYELIKKEMLSPLAVAFQEEIRANRAGKLVAATDGILSGKTFTGATIVEIGLADEVGNLSMAIKYAANQSIAQDFINNF